MAQLGKAAINAATGRGIKVGTLGAGLGKGLAAYFIGTQILNLITRKQFTWQNEEKGHKLDAWIPDFTGKTPGYFISPFSVAAELTHDVIRYSHWEPDVLSVASKILANKASPLARAGKVLTTGRDWNDQKLVGAWEKAKAAAWALAPAPIPVQPMIKGGPAGQAQRQAFGSAGFKIEPAPTAQDQIFEMVNEWKKNNRDPKLRQQLERFEREQMAPSDYKPLKQALIKEDKESARDEYLKLKEMGKTGPQIRREFQTPKPFTGSAENDLKFYNTLTPQEKEVWKRAKQERRDLLKKFNSFDKTKRP